MKLLLILALTTAIGAAASDATPASLRAMQAADKNQDGKLTLAEYLPLDVQAKHHGEEHFSAGDTNKDGFLDVTELTSTLRKQTWFAILSEGTETCFTRLDTNKDSKLEASEYRKISRMGAHAEQHFKGADLNHDGFLNRAEFVAHAEAKLKVLEVPDKNKPAK
jgi:hypothetical protein